MKKSTGNDPLPSWDSGTTSKARENIIDFVTAVTTQGSYFVEPSERIAVFDNDGTLWSEQPTYFQVPFIEQRMDQQTAGEEETIEEYRQAVMDWLDTTPHPTKRPYRYKDLVYQPMLELLAYLRDNEFKTFIVSGGGMEFVRPWSEEVYGIPPEQVIGSSVKTAYRENPPAVVRLPDESGDGSYEETYFVDDKEGKVVGINQHIGRRPIAAFGNSAGDTAMLDWTTAGAGRRFALLIHHTDDVHEWDYDAPGTGPPPGSIQQNPSGQLTHLDVIEAKSKGWTVVDMAKDWKVVYPHEMIPLRKGKGRAAQRSRALQEK